MICEVCGQSATHFFKVTYAYKSLNQYYPHLTSAKDLRAMRKQFMGYMATCDDCYQTYDDSVDFRIKIVPAIEVMRDKLKSLI